MLLSIVLLWAQIHLYVLYRHLHNPLSVNPPPSGIAPGWSDASWRSENHWPQFARILVTWSTWKSSMYVHPGFSRSIKFHFHLTEDFSLHAKLGWWHPSFLYGLYTGACKIRNLQWGSAHVMKDPNVLLDYTTISPARPCNVPVKTYTTVSPKSHLVWSVSKGTVV